LAQSLTQAEKDASASLHDLAIERLYSRRKDMLHDQAPFVSVQQSGGIIIFATLDEA
jgi:hypothetical protein